MALQEHEQQLWDSAMISLAADSDVVENYVRAHDEAHENAQLDDVMHGHLNTLMLKLHSTYGLGETAAWEALSVRYLRDATPVTRNTKGCDE